MVFLGLFPLNADDYQASRQALEKLRLSDSAFTFRPISSLALGNGFHCGFLGLLHAEIVQERLSREFGIQLIATAPSVEYKLSLKSNLSEKLVKIQSASEFPDPSLIDEAYEPFMQLSIFAPKKYVGAVMQLAQEKRGQYVDLRYTGDQAQFTYLVPLSEMIIDFFDRLKSISQGFASLDYKFFDFQRVDLVKVDILVNHEKVDAFAFLTSQDQAQSRGRDIVEKLAQILPRQQFSIPVQATVGSPRGAAGSPRSRSGEAGGQVIARSDVKPFRKDVIAKLYGGDRTRKDKLLEAQRKGKAKMKLVGRVEIPQSAFFQVLKRG